MYVIIHDNACIETKSYIYNSISDISRDAWNGRKQHQDLNSSYYE